MIELQVGPVSAILGFYLLAQCLTRRPPARCLSLFAVGAIFPTLILLTYNQLAFGSPWDMGYFHHATKQFADVHNADNPLGLRFPDQFWHKLLALLWGRYRGLTFYAPILLLTVPGWVVLIVRRYWDLAVVTFLRGRRGRAREPVLPRMDGRLVDRSAAARSADTVRDAARGRPPGGRFTRATARHDHRARPRIGRRRNHALVSSGGGRIPHDYADPLVQTVWPIWTGQVPLPGWRFGERFTRNVTSLIAPGWIDRLSPRWQLVQFLPLVLVQDGDRRPAEIYCRRHRSLQHCR